MSTVPSGQPSTAADADAAQRRSMFGRKSLSKNNIDAGGAPAPASSSSVVAGSLRPIDSNQPTMDPAAAAPSSYSNQPTSATTAAMLAQPADIQRLLHEQQIAQQAEAEQARLKDQREQAELLARLQAQQLPSDQQPVAPINPVRSDPLVLPTSQGSTVAASLASPKMDPSEVDHSVDPNAPPPGAQLPPGIAPDGLTWMQKSSMQQSPVTVYYSKDPISNLQLRVLLRKQPDDASASSQPKTFKQLNLAMKEKAKREEREREELNRSVAGQTSAAAMHRRIEEGDEAAELVAEQRDAQGRVSLSPNPESEFKPSVIAIQLFSWQQKVVSPAEIMLAATGRKQAASYAEQVHQMLKERYPTEEPEAAARKLLASQREGMMLSSKRDHDRYIDPDDRFKAVTTSKKRELNPLAERVVLAPLVSKRNESHLTREGGHTPFHILATVDLPHGDPSKVQLLYKDHQDTDTHPPQIAGAFQKPLASIKAIEGDEYVTLEIRPPFSPPMKDSNPGATFDDAEWYSFYTPSGEHYRYRLENYSGVIEDTESALTGSGPSRTMIALEQRQVEAELLRMAQHDMQVAIHRSGREFDVGPLKGLETWHVLGEIIKTTGFMEESLAISYELDLRNNLHEVGVEDVWTTGISDHLEAVTQTSQARFESAPQAGKPQQRASYFSFPFDFKLTKRQQTQALAPVMYFQVHSQNSWGIGCIIGYGFIHLPLTPGLHEFTVDTWVPLGGLRDQKTKYFVGAGPTLRDVKLCGVPSDKSVLNRYGWQCSANGTIHLRFEVVHLRPATAAPASRQTTSLALDSLRTQYLRNASSPGSPPFSPTSPLRSADRTGLLQRSQTTRR